MNRCSTRKEERKNGDQRTEETKKGKGVVTKTKPSFPRPVETLIHRRARSMYISSVPLTSLLFGLIPNFVPTRYGINLSEYIPCQMRDAPIIYVFSFLFSFLLSLALLLT